MFFRCEIHGEKFESLEAIKEHDARFHGKGVGGGVAGVDLKCSECGRSFRDSSTFNRHIFTHSTNRPFCCHTCKKRFPHPNALTTHLRTCKSPTPTPPTKASKDKPKKCEGTGDEKFTCGSCCAQFKGIFSYSQHLKSKHKEFRDNFCTVCDTQFSSKCDLKRHLRAKIHGKGVRRLEKILSPHPITHPSSEDKELRPYHCGVGGCGMKYALKCHLNRHMRSGHPSLDQTASPHKQAQKRGMKSGDLKMSAIFSNLFFKIK